MPLPVCLCICFSGCLCISTSVYLCISPLFVSILLPAALFPPPHLHCISICHKFPKGNLWYFSLHCTVFYHSPTRCPLSSAPSSLYQNRPRVSLPCTVFPLSKLDIDSLLRSPFGNFFLFTFLLCHFGNYSFYLPSRGEANHYKFPFGNLCCSSIPGRANCFGFTFGNLFCSSIHLAEPSFASLLLETSAVHLSSGKANCCKFTFGNFYCSSFPLVKQYFASFLLKISAVHLFPGKLTAASFLLETSVCLS